MKFTDLLRNLLLATCFLGLGALPIVAQNVLLDWAYQFPESLRIRDVARSDSGYLYMVGSIRDTLDIDPGPDTLWFTPPSGEMDAYVAKFDTNLTLIWAKQIGGESRDQSRSLAVDQHGAVVLEVETSGIVDADPGAGISLMNVDSVMEFSFLLKLDAAGTFLWAREQPYASNYLPSCLAMDEAGNVYFAGMLGNNHDLDPGPGQYIVDSYGAMDAYVQKLSSTGQLLWGGAMGGPGWDRATALVVQEGAVYVAGYFQGQADFDPGTNNHLLSSVAHDDIFLQKFDTAGQFLWAQAYGGTEEDRCYALTVDDLGYIYLGATFAGSLDMHPGADTLMFYNLQNLETDGVVAKLDSSGLPRWAYQVRSPGWEDLIFLSVDDQGYVYATGTFQQTVDFDPGPGQVLRQAGFGQDAFVQRLTPSGDLTWINTWGSNVPLYPSGLIIDPQRNLYLTGAFNHRMDADPNPDSLILDGGAGDYEAFFLKLNADSCSDLGLRLDLLTELGCDTTAQVVGQPIGGAPPYTYTWQTSPTTHDSSLIIHTPGHYPVTLTDGYGCERQTSLVVAGPISSDSSTFDLQAHLIAPNTFRPGRTSVVTLDAFNAGCQPVAGSVTLVLDSLVSLDSVEGPLPTILGDTLVWAFSGWSYDSVHLTPRLHLTPDTTVNIGDQICLQTYILPLRGDVDSSNNQGTLCVDVVNSYDPNDKQVSPRGACDPGYVLLDQRLTYTVRFQNTGNAPAIDVVIRDTLSPHLRGSSLHVLSASHAHLTTQLSEDGVAIFTWRDIYLPDSISSPSASQGYVIFSISPRADIDPFTSVTNRVGIYFDFNPPVITNTVQNVFVAILPELMAEVQPMGEALQASLEGDTYQWLRCDSTVQPIVAARARSYQPTEDGSYAVVVQKEGCTDTSACFAFTATRLPAPQSNLRIYPNPTDGWVSLAWERPWPEVTVSVYDVMGRRCQEQRFHQTTTARLELTGPKGVYLLRIQTGKQVLQRLVRRE